MTTAFAITVAALAVGVIIFAWIVDWHERRTGKASDQPHAGN